MHIQVKNISKSFGGNLLWENISFELLPKDLVAFTGKSGSGKTTLLNSLGLLESVSSGQILFNNSSVEKLNGFKRVKLYKHTVGFVFQNYGLIEDETAEQNLKYALKFLKKSPQEKKKILNHALSEVGLSGRNMTMVYTLSGGEQQRLSLAKVLIKNPKLILCDEPSAALDEENTSIIMNLLNKLAENGSIVVISTHDKLVYSQCTKVFTIKDKKQIRIK
ncbi:MAG: ABC transporter ATP-binding protein [Candidatus Ancillula sp.]|jgi:putative ABC transport system ATP-binding protein|nr:ABC transporter ATP-binding protein [Candidatus Ancillula sp.]